GEKEDGRGAGHATTQRWADMERDRSVAADTASMKTERTARASRVRTPAAVVPAGEVTMARSTAGSSPVSASSLADPDMVSTTRVRLTSRVSPICTPDSMRASATRKKYAGP